jgi:hypothetical protein
MAGWDNDRMPKAEQLEVIEHKNWLRTGSIWLKSKLI